MMKKNRQNLLILVCILSIGFFIRWGALTYVCGPPVTAYPTMDEMNFRELAENILNYRQFAAWTEGFLTVSTRAPVYPLLISSGYTLAGKSLYSVPKVINLIFDLSNILLLFFLARSLFNYRIGLVTAWIYAIFGHAAYFMAISSPHTVAVSLLILAALSLICIKRSYWWSIPAFAVTYSLLIHTRPVFLIALPFIFVAVWVQLSNKKEDNGRETTAKHWLLQNPKKKLWKSSVPILLILLLCLPWGIRNYRKHKIIVPVSIVSGWHIASNVNYDIKLSIKYLTDQLYAPERHAFSEADYFKAARQKLTDAFFENPFKFLLYGFARIAYCWTPHGLYYRFLLPKAYVFPIFIFGGTLLPLPDFEGILYLFIAATLVASFFLKKKILQSFADVFYQMRGILVIIIGYTLVHCIGIPLIAYRYLVEPFILIIFTGLIFHYATSIKQAKNLTSDKLSRTSKPSKNSIRTISSEYFRKFCSICDISNHRSKLDSQVIIRKNLILVYSAIFLILLAMNIPFFIEHKPEKYTYFALLKSKNILTYAEIRQMQWKNLGNIDQDTSVIVQGVVRYVHPGFKFIEKDYYAAKNNDFTAARLYVCYGEDKNLLGTGDVRLNIKSADIPNDGDKIKVIGKAKTGPFKEIIIDVERWY